MSAPARTYEIKRAQRQAIILKELSKLFLAISLDDPRLQDLFITRVILSADRSSCFVQFYSTYGRTRFEECMPTLILYKPSLRKALAQIIQARYTPNLVFEFDSQMEKQVHIESLLDKVKREAT